MQQHRRRSGLIVLAWMLLILSGASSLVYANEPAESGPVVIRGAYQSEPVTPHEFTGDLRDLPRAKEWQPGDPIREVPRKTYPRNGGIRQEGASSEATEQAQDSFLEPEEQPAEKGQTGEDRAFSTPTVNIDGIAFTGVRPPDPNGDVGPNHYIQLVNSSGGTNFNVYNKSGTLLAGPTTLDSLWTAGGACASGFGDPIVLYDSLADRWLLSEFASTGNHLCLYISQTPNPISGGWFLYDFAVPNFPDYPKYAVWPDAYYVGTNESSPAVYALDRNRMLNGQSATFQRFTAPALLAFPFQMLLPSDLDGATPPPAGSSNYFMRHRDDEANNPGANDPTKDFLEIWQFHVDFANPANSTFTGPLNIALSEFDSDVCGFSSFNCFPQPGTSVTLDPIREVLMWRLQYRNFGTLETLVGNFTVDVNGADRGGIRWFELRKMAGGGWTLFQEGTYTPDAANRWMGSIAMNGLGDIALGYSVSSSSVFPSLRYTGRLAGDPLGTLPQGENTLIAGGGSQSNNRWGDYSSMTVDPSDDCTFWYTGEYMPSGTTTQWRTRIGSFKFPSCGGGGNQSPIAEANGPYSGGVGSPINFSSAGSTDPDGTIVSYSWNFGDGKRPSNQPNPPHSYSAAGMFTATLTVTDNLGTKGTDTATVTVGGSGNQSPVAQANGPYSGKRNVPISFSSAGSTDPDGTIVSYSWNFGDGTPPSSSPNPSHAYTNTGGYTATLTVTDNLGATGIESTAVMVTR